MAETTVKTLLCCGFPLTCKAMGRVYQCWRRIFREMFLRFEYHMLDVLYPFVTYLLSFPRSVEYNETGVHQAVVGAS